MFDENIKNSARIVLKNCREKPVLEYAAYNLFFKKNGNIIVLFCYLQNM